MRYDKKIVELTVTVELTQEEYNNGLLDQIAADEYNLLVDIYDEQTMLNIIDLQEKKCGYSNISIEEKENLKAGYIELATHSI